MLQLVFSKLIQPTIGFKYKACNQPLSHHLPLVSLQIKLLVKNDKLNSEYTNAFAYKLTYAKNFPKKSFVYKPNISFNQTYLSKRKVEIGIIQPNIILYGKTTRKI